MVTPLVFLWEVMGSNPSQGEIGVLGRSGDFPVQFPPRGGGVSTEVMGDYRRCGIHVHEDFNTCDVDSIRFTDDKMNVKDGSAMKRLSEHA
ncbi:hypothetical protein E3N88_05469 [Mikania micrantha]|uniref:Uncharacterized protein n=1 Tax=Mikania micrantha TaxID=192012 RepID=A0A5N6PL07_9ASTR|nr:hypothetical protein E3N88_05469 [Mikania micrantha]